MRRVLFFIIIFAALSAKVMAYKPMLVDGKRWNYYRDDGDPARAYHWYYVLRGEKEMGGHQCKVLYRSQRDGQETAYAYLHEEGMRVYYVNVKTGESLLLYDFSLQKGDTVNDPFYDASYVVVYVGEMNGGRLLIQLIELGEYAFNRYWIEGIGCEHDLLLPLDIPMGNPSILLTVEEGGKTVYTNGNATALNSVKSDGQTDSMPFDLQGRHINSLPAKGIYIRDGRKVLVGK